MKVQSTGLGKTVMLAQFKELSRGSFDDRQVLQMTMEAVQPLHWTIRVHLEPKDLRKIIGLGLRPVTVWKVILALLLGRFTLFPKAEGVVEGPPMPAAEPAPFVNPVASSGSSDRPNPLAALKG